MTIVDWAGIISGIIAIITLILYFFDKYETNPLEISCKPTSSLATYYIDNDLIKQKKPKYFFHLDNYLSSKKKSKFNLKAKKEKEIFFDFFYLTIEVHNKSSEQINICPYIPIKITKFRKCNLDAENYSTIDFAAIGGPAYYEYFESFVGENNCDFTLGHYTAISSDFTEDGNPLQTNIEENSYIKIKPKEKVIIRLDVSIQINCSAFIKPYLIYSFKGKQREKYFENGYKIQSLSKFSSYIILNENQFKWIEDIELFNKEELWEKSKEHEKKSLKMNVEENQIINNGGFFDLRQ